MFCFIENFNVITYMYKPRDKTEAKNLLKLESLNFVINLEFVDDLLKKAQ